MPEPVEDREMTTTGRSPHTFLIDSLCLNLYAHMCNYYTLQGVADMPNFDGTGPLKRGRIIGRGLGPCKKCSDGFEYQTNPPTLQVKEETPAE